jgi:N-acylneuraminate cytidylyltransferase
MKLALIPARGGSKRIPRKNIKPFCGKPIVAWSIEAARASGCFDRIVGSTDDEEIADVARAAGADVPFMRPAELADDHAGTIPVVRHAIEWQRAHGPEPRQVCCLYATAPFVTADDLREGLARLDPGDGVNFVFPVARYAYPIQRALRLAADGHVSMFQPDEFRTRSQDLEPAYHDAGQFYWGTTDGWMAAETMFGTASIALVRPPWRVQDIDVAEDWQRAEVLFQLSQDAR